MDHTSTSAVFRADYFIENVTTSDSGTYTCTVINPIGSDSTTIRVVGKLLMTGCMYYNYNYEELYRKKLSQGYLTQVIR